MEEENKKVKFVNVMFDFFINEKTAFTKIRNSKFKEEYASERYELFKLFSTIIDSPACQAYIRTKQELFEKFKESQKDLADDDLNKKPPLLMNIKGMAELMEHDSGFEIDKVDILSRALPPEITADDMLAVRWIINFIDDRGKEASEEKEP